MASGGGGGGEYTPLMMQLQEMKNADDVEEIILAEDRSAGRDLEAGIGDAAAMVCQANCLTDPQVRTDMQENMWARLRYSRLGACLFHAT